METANPMMTLVKDFYRTIDAQQWDEQESFVSKEFVALLGSSLQLSFKDWQGRLHAFFNAFPDGVHELNFYLVEGDRILSVGNFTGTHQNEFMEFPPSGNHIDMGVMHLDRVVGNKIVEHIAAADLLGLSHQIKAKNG